MLSFAHEGADPRRHAHLLVIMAHTLGMFGFSWLSGRLIGRFGALVLITGSTLLLHLAAVMAPPAEGGVTLLAICPRRHPFAA